MITVTDAEFQEQFGHYKKAAQTEPVHVTSFDHEGIVVMATSEYRKLTVNDRQALYAWEFSEDEMKEFENIEIPPETKQFDHELES